jgi:NADPH:quinone reductase-like Zn-dependent oxidoreductase
MRAIRFSQVGSLSQLHFENIPTPVIKTNEVLIEIHAAAINPSDVKNVLGAMHHTTLPRIPGRDFAGVIVEGSGNLIGTEVWGSGGDLGFTRDGTHAEYLVLPVDAVKPKPENLSMSEAAAVGTSFITAWMGLIDAAQLQAGETVLVIGATGAVGSAVIQIAKWKGAFVIATVRQESDDQIAKNLGVDVVIDLKKQTLPDAVLTATDNQGVDVVYDTVGGSMFEPCLKTLALKGRQIEISSPLDNRQVCFDLLDFYRRELKLLGVNSLSADAIACGDILAQLTPGFKKAKLHPPLIGQSYPLQDAVIAYEQVLNRTVAGKVILNLK